MILLACGSGPSISSIKLKFEEITYGTPDSGDSYGFKCDISEFSDETKKIIVGYADGFYAKIYYGYVFQIMKFNKKNIAYEYVQSYDSRYATSIKNDVYVCIATNIWNNNPDSSDVQDVINLFESCF